MSKTHKTVLPRPNYSFKGNKNACIIVPLTQALGTNMKIHAISKAIVALVATMLVSGISAQELQFPFKNHTIEAKGPAKFESRNGEFEFQLPLAAQRVEFGSFHNKRLYAHNIDSLSSNEHFAIEWIYLDEPFTVETFNAYWDAVLADYLAKNFGSGRFTIVEMKKTLDPTKQRAIIEFVGTGTGTDGFPGAIFGQSSHFGKRMATTYKISHGGVTTESASDRTPEIEATRKLAQSIACTSQSCASTN